MIIFDLDDTLRCTKDSRHLHPLDPTKTWEWVGWQNHVNEHGKPKSDIVDLYSRYYLKYRSVPMTVLTGSQYGTSQWFINNGIHHPDKIIERPGDCHLPPFEYKRQWIDSNHKDIFLWVDDDHKVCDYVRSLGKQVIQVG